MGSITTNGTGVTYGSASDRRLKTDIKPLGAAISLKALKAYDPSDYLLRGQYAVGAVAQWVDARMKAVGIDAAEIGLVHRGDDDIHRKPTDKGFVQWQMDSSKMMPYTIRTILDQEDRITALERENSTLSAKLVRLQHLQAANDNQSHQIDELKAQVNLLARRIEIKTARN